MQVLERLSMESLNDQPVNASRAPQSHRRRVAREVSKRPTILPLLRERSLSVGHVVAFREREDGSGYDFSAPTRFDKLFTGIVVERPSRVEGSQRGVDHLGPEDTYEGDYGRLLEQAER